MKIKRITAEDTNALYNLGLQQFKGEFWYTKKFLKDSIKNSEFRFGAFEGKKMLGGILVQQSDKPKLWIYFFIVDKKHRREGIGGKLLKSVEKIRIKGFDMLFVDFEPTDILAKNFYTKYGFKKSAKIKNWFGPHTYALLYAKKFF